MDIEALRLFVRAADLLNISAAGRDLGLSPAVASTRLAKLELQTGVELLHRSTRKVSLSVEGAEWLPYARDILSVHDSGLAALGQGDSEVAGTVRFATSSTFAQLHIVPLLPALFARHPKLQLDLRLTDMPRDLLEGSFDLALRSAELEDSSLKARKLCDVETAFYASPDYIARRGPPSSPIDLKEHELLVFAGMTRVDLVSSRGDKAEVDFRGPRMRLQIDDGASMREATIGGLGISMNADWSVAPAVQHGDLVRVLPEWTVDQPIALWLVYPKSNVLTGKVRALIDFLVEKLGSCQPWKFGT